MERDDLAMIAEALERMLGEAPLEAIDAASGQGEQAADLWGRLAENGYPLLCASEDLGGFGASLADAASVASIAGRRALCLPLSDTVLAVGLLSAAGLEAPALRLGIADPLDGAAPLPHAMQVDAIVSLVDASLRVERLDPDSLTAIRGAEDGAGVPSCGPREVIAEGRAPDWLSPLAFRGLAGFMRAAAMAGAMQSVLELTLSFTQEREQFGRPLAKFQAIQHHLADIACETAAAAAAVELAADALRADPELSQSTLEALAIAKIRCGDAAGRVGAASHQAHGAMGFTREYALGKYTRRLWQWQDEFGASAAWAIVLGNAVLDEATPQLWPRISQPI